MKESLQQPVLRARQPELLPQAIQASLPKVSLFLLLATMARRKLQIEPIDHYQQGFLP
jgi:hypothetical protein